MPNHYESCPHTDLRAMWESGHTVYPCKVQKRKRDDNDPRPEKKDRCLSCVQRGHPRIECSSDELFAGNAERRAIMRNVPELTRKGNSKGRYEYRFDSVCSFGTDFAEDVCVQADPESQVPNF